jgi:PTH2 family peptidyl-tRNA hydrolase
MIMKYKMLIAIREDIGLSCGKKAAQASHAAVCCALEAKKTHSKWFKKWRSEGGKKVVVKVENLEDLHELEKEAKNRDIPSCMITDAGLTEVPPNTVTCLGLGPAPNELIDPLTGKLPLL